MNIALIIKEMEPEVAKRGCFITDVSVSADNDIVIAIESEEGTVEMDDCVAVSERFQEIFNRDEEDYALTVTSAGLDQPFKILKQYRKAVGSLVEVKTRDGRKIIGTLTSAEEEAFTLAYEAREPFRERRKRNLSDTRTGSRTVT